MATTSVRRLVPAMVGAGKAVHLGYLSTDLGPHGEPRYAAACRGGRRAKANGGRVSTGPAVSQQINCRNCRRDHGKEVERINAEVAAGVDFTT